MSQGALPNTPPQRENRRLMAPERTPQQLPRSPPPTSRELNLSGNSSINTSTTSQTRSKPIIVVGAVAPGSNSSRLHVLGTKTSPTPRSMSAGSSASTSYHAAVVPVASDAIPHSSLMTSVPGHIVGSDPWEDEDDMPLARKYSHLLKKGNAPSPSNNASLAQSSPGRDHQPSTITSIHNVSAPSSIRSSVSLQPLASTMVPSASPSKSPATIQNSPSVSISPYAKVQLRSPPGSTLVGHAPEDSLNTSALTDQQQQPARRRPHRDLPAPTPSPSKNPSANSSYAIRGDEYPVPIQRSDAVHPPPPPSNGPWSILYNDETTNTTTNVSQSSHHHRPEQPMGVVRRENDLHHLSNCDLQDAIAHGIDTSTIYEDEVDEPAISTAGSYRPIVGSIGKPIGASPERMRFRSSSKSPSQANNNSTVNDASSTIFPPPTPHQQDHDASGGRQEDVSVLNGNVNHDANNTTYHNDAVIPTPADESSFLLDCDTSTITDVNASMDTSSVVPAARSGFTRRQCADKEDEDYLKDALRHPTPSLPPADAHLPPNQRSPTAPVTQQRRLSYSASNAAAPFHRTGSASPAHQSIHNTSLPQDTSDIDVNQTDMSSVVERRLSDQPLSAQLEMYIQIKNLSTDTSSQGQVIRDGMHLGPKSKLDMVDFAHSPEGRKHRETLTYHEPNSERSPGGARQLHNPSSPQERLPQRSEDCLQTSPPKRDQRRDSSAYFKGAVQHVSMSSPKQTSPQRPLSDHHSMSPSSCAPLQYGPPVTSSATREMYEAFAGPQTSKEYPPDLMLWRMMSKKAEEERLLAAKMLERLEQRRAEREKEEADADEAREALKNRSRASSTTPSEGVEQPHLGLMRRRSSAPPLNDVSSIQDGIDSSADISIPSIKPIPTHTSVSTRERAGFWGRPTRDTNGRRLPTSTPASPSGRRHSSASQQQHQGNGSREGEATPAPSSALTGVHTQRQVSSARPVARLQPQDDLDARYGPLPPDKAEKLFDQLCQSPSRFVINHAVSPGLKKTANEVDIELSAAWSTRGRVLASEESYTAKSAAMRCILLEGILTNCEASETAARYAIAREWEAFVAVAQRDHSLKYMQVKINQLIKRWQIERSALERESDRRFQSIEADYVVEGHRAGLLGDLKAMLSNCVVNEGGTRNAILEEEHERWSSLIDQHRGGKFSKLVNGLVDGERAVRNAIMREGYLAHMSIFDDERRARRVAALSAWSAAHEKRTLALLAKLQEEEREARAAIKATSITNFEDLQQKFLRIKDIIDSRERSERDLQRREEELRKRMLARQKEDRAAAEHNEGKGRAQVVSDEHTARIGILNNFDGRFSFVSLESEERVSRAQITKEVQPAVDHLKEQFRRGKDDANARRLQREEADRLSKIQKDLEAKARRSRPFIGFALAEKVMDGRRAGETSAPAAVASGAQPHLVVDALFVGGPAYKQGLRLNDTVVSIAGEAALSLAQVRLTIAKRAIVGGMIEVVVRAPVHDPLPPSSHNESIASKPEVNLAASGTFGCEMQSNGSETPDEYGRRSPATESSDANGISPVANQGHPVNTSIQSAGSVRRGVTGNSRPPSPLMAERSAWIPVMTADVSFASLTEWFFDITKHHQVTREMDNTVVLRSVRSFVSKQNQLPSVSPESAHNPDTSSPTNRLGSSFRGDSLQRSGSRFRMGSDDDEGDDTINTSPPFRPSPQLPPGKPPLALNPSHFGSPIPSGAASPTSAGPIRRGGSSNRLGSKGPVPAGGSFRKV